MLGSSQKHHRRGAICIVINNEAVVNATSDCEDNDNDYDEIDRFTGRRNIFEEFWKYLRRPQWSQPNRNNDLNNRCARVNRPREG